MRVTTNDAKRISTRRGWEQPGRVRRQRCRRRRRRCGRADRSDVGRGAGTEEVIVPAPAGIQMRRSERQVPDFSSGTRVATLVPLQPRGELARSCPVTRDRCPTWSFHRMGGGVAFESDESGRFEVYVRPFRTSTHDASGLLQRRSASALVAEWTGTFYIAADGMMMAVPIELRRPSHQRPAGCSPRALLRERARTTITCRTARVSSW